MEFYKLNYLKLFLCYYLTDPTGPFQGTSDNAKAALAALIAIVSGGFVASTAIMLHAIWVS